MSANGRRNVDAVQKGLIKLKASASAAGANRAGDGAARALRGRGASASAASSGIAPTSSSLALGGCAARTNNTAVASRANSIAGFDGPYFIGTVE